MLSSKVFIACKIPQNDKLRTLNDIKEKNCRKKKKRSFETLNFEQTIDPDNKMTLVHVIRGIEMSVVTSGNTRTKQTKEILFP